MPKFNLTKNSKLGLLSLLFLGGIVKYECYTVEATKTLKYKIWFVNDKDEVVEESYTQQEPYDFSVNITRTADLVNSVLKDMEAT